MYYTPIIVNDDDRRSLSETNKTIKIHFEIFHELRYIFYVYLSSRNILTNFFISPLLHDNHSRLLIRCSLFRLANGEEKLFEISTVSITLENNSILFSLFLMSDFI